MKKTLSIAQANLLFLISILLVLVVGSIVQAFSLSWGLMLTELALILLPAVLFLRWKKIPLREGLRLKAISPLLAILAVLLGIFTYLFTLFIEGWMMRLTQAPSISLPEGALPKDAVGYILYFIAIAILPPLCEEALFRGVAQSAYERTRKPWFAISMVALMFAFYHFRVTGLPGLLPIAFLLGWAAWRTGSLVTSILLHFGVNALSAGNTIYALATGTAGIPLTSVPLTLLGVLGAAACVTGIVLITRAQKRREQAARPALTLGQLMTEPLPASESSHSFLYNYWALGVAALIYLAVAALTVLMTIAPELAVTQSVQFSAPAPAALPSQDQYQLITKDNRLVGRAVCTLSPNGKQILWECARTVQTAYQVRTGNSFFQENANTQTISATWDSTTLALQEYAFHLRAADTNYQVTLQGGSLIAELPDGTRPSLQIPAGTLLQDEWAWRTRYLQGQGGSSYRASMVYRSRWNEKTQKNAPLAINGLLKVIPLDRITLPDGAQDTWVAALGDQTAWYSVQDGRLVQFDDGMLQYRWVK